VYTELGAINWLPDLPRWAKVVTNLLRPGGRLYLAEFHPFRTFAEGDLTVERSYFERGPIVRDDDPGTYANRAADTHNNRSVEWHHTLGDVVTAVASAGLRIEYRHEHAFMRRRFRELTAEGCSMRTIGPRGSAGPPVWGIVDGPGMTDRT